VLTMNSVKILHAVRSAITATAELLVFLLISAFVVVLYHFHGRNPSGGDFVRGIMSGGFVQGDYVLDSKRAGASSGRGLGSHWEWGTQPPPQRSFFNF